jgi:hypothetical protein
MGAVLEIMMMANTSKKDGKSEVSKAGDQTAEIGTVIETSSTDQVDGIVKTHHEAPDPGEPRQISSDLDVGVDIDAAMGAVVGRVDSVADQGASPSADEGTEQLIANSSPQVKVEIFPVRTYLDCGVLKRRGGTGYKVSRRHADALIIRGLASLTREL